MAAMPRGWSTLNELDVCLAKSSASNDAESNFQAPGGRHVGKCKVAKKRSISRADSFGFTPVYARLQL